MLRAIGVGLGAAIASACFVVACSGGGSGECACHEEACNAACVAAEYPSGACSKGECLCLRRASEPPPPGKAEPSLGDRLMSGLRKSAGSWLSGDQTCEGRMEECLEECGSGAGKACAKVGWSYQYGLGVPQDLNKAFAHHGKACDAGEAAGCCSLGWLHEHGHGTAEDYPKARQMYQKACDSGEEIGCYGLGWLYEKGRGGPLDLNKAKELFAKSCDGGEVSKCTNIALRFRLGEKSGAPRDNAKARELFGKSCDGGVVKACISAGKMFSQEPGPHDPPTDFAKARWYLIKACDGGLAEGCVELASMYENGRGVPLDLNRAKQEYGRACKRELKSACRKLKSL